MARHLRFRGGARLNPRGEFEVYLGGGTDQHERRIAECPTSCPAFREMVREYYEFLMSEDQTRKIGEETAKKTMTRKRGRPMVTFTIMNLFEVTLLQFKGQFALMFFQLPFLASEGDSEALMNEYYEELMEEQSHDELEEEYIYG